MKAILGSVAALALAASAPLAASAAPVSSADKGSAEVVDTETVQVYLDASGKVQSQRVYEQLVLRGSGQVEVSNPVSTDGLRNLDGFGGLDVRDGAQVASYDLDAAGGVIRERTVSDHEGDMPLEVSVRYLLDGKEVEPGDVVGASGRLEVEYTVENTTVRTQEVEIPDGRGGTTTREVPVAVPFAGSMETTLPANFTEVESERGNLAGDGRGGTKVNFTLTLFPPIGATTTKLAWAADVTDGVIPRAELSALPVNPMASPTFATAANGYRNGTASGTQLADGAREIDANLLKLRDGAQDLLGGLVKLHEGAGRLRDGLRDKALPGARKLADGSARVSGGLHDAATGSTDLRDGLSRISDGLGKLADVEGLPDAADGAARLKAGVDQVLAGFGAVGTDETLLDGLYRLETGLAALFAGLVQLKGDGSAKTPGLVGAKGGVDQSKAGVDQSRAGVGQVIAGLDGAVSAGGSIDQLLGGLQLLTTLDCGPTCQGLVASKLVPGVQDSKTKLTAARDGLAQVTGGLDRVSGGLGQVSGGLAQAIGGLQTQLIPGAERAVGGATKANAGAKKLAAGLGEIRTGLYDLETGLTKAVAGVLALDAGAGEAHAGAGDLSAGLGLLDNGAGALADGNAELATKLVEPVDGATRIADGLGEARGGAPKLVDGAGRLSDEGAKVMAGKGETAAQDYGELVAVMEAGAKRADAEKMAYGAPEGALGLTAYNVVIQGEDGATGRNLARGVVGGGLAAAAAGLVLLRRRLV